jgi:mannose-6-phosphate isomerase
MGVHPNGPSVVAETGESLATLVAANPALLLGEAVNSRFSGQLPFLFKVLR